jgi:hypothetical protein
MNISLSILVLFGLFNMISCWWQASPTCPELKPMDNFDLNKVVLSYIITIIIIITILYLISI